MLKSQLFIRIIIAESLEHDELEDISFGVIRKVISSALVRERYPAVRAFGLACWFISRLSDDGLDWT